jgi:hypothetical protein
MAALATLAVCPQCHRVRPIRERWFGGKQLVLGICGHVVPGVPR